MRIRAVELAIAAMTVCGGVGVGVFRSKLRERAAGGTACVYREH
jgi:hypothetical protein